MTAVITEQVRPADGTGRRKRAGLAGTLRAERTKIFSVRSTYWALALLMLVAVGWSIGDCAGVAAHWSHTPAQARAGLDPTQDSLIGLVLLGQLVIVALGALTITTEYSTQAIRTSLTVMPRRGVLFTAKGLVFTVVAAVVAFAASFIAFFTGQALLASTHAGATLSQPNVLRAIVASAIVVVLCGLLTYGVGAALRSTAATMTTVYGILFLLPQLVRALPVSWYDDVIRWIPGGQYDGVISSTGSAQLIPHMFGIWGEVAVMAGYAILGLALGAWAMHRRDA
jgi:ABC-2 type transport system permease protein